MTREELRTQLLAGADALRNSIAWRLMTTEQRALSATGRQFWAQDNAVTNAALDAFVELLPSMRGLPPMPRRGVLGFVGGTCGVLRAWIGGMLSGDKKR